jgi:hypothetical protein
MVFIAFTSCQKEDEAVILPPPGDLTKVIADIGAGPSYNEQVYVSLSKNMQVSRNIKDWDIAFEASPNGYRVYLNTGKNMFACHTGVSSFTDVDTVGKEWHVDNAHLDDDSTAIGTWYANNLSTNEVLVIDRGKIFYNGASASQRFKKIKLESVNTTSYTFSYSDFNSSVPVSFTLNKNADYSLMYFSFDGGGHAVDIAPPKDEWDVVFTRYIYTFFEEPVGSPFRYYLVTGGLINRWNEVTGVKLVKDSIPGYISFEQVNAVSATSFTYTKNADVIGYDWKALDNSLNFVVLPNRYYLVKDRSGFIYKMRFIDFYSTTGASGYITFQYQRL